MKGVSEVIAIILILMIVIALAALAYTWFSGVFAGLTGTAGTAVTQTTGAMALQFRIESARYSSASGTYITIRNTGTQSFNASHQVVGIYIDNNLITATPTITAGAGCTCGSANGYMLEKGCVVTYAFTTAQVPGVCAGATCPGTCANVTKITIATGLTDTMQIAC